LAGVLQAPLPSQVEAGVTEDALAQTAALQFTPLSRYAQAPPTQFPVVPQALVVVRDALALRIRSFVGHGAASSDLQWQIAGHARLGTGGIAAHALGTEARLTLRS
jgi:hypothetical protein